MVEWSIKSLVRFYTTRLHRSIKDQKLKEQRKQVKAQRSKLKGQREQGKEQKIRGRSLRGQSKRADSSCLKDKKKAHSLFASEPFSYSNHFVGKPVSSLAQFVEEAADFLNKPPFFCHQEYSDQAGDSYAQSPCCPPSRAVID
jgi:hypothetical protein